MAYMLMKIKGCYPASMNGMSDQETTLTLETWVDMFKDYDAELINKALDEVIKTSTSSFMPSIGAIIQKAEEIKKRPVPFKGYITMGTPEHKAFLEQQAKKKNELQ